MMGIVAGRRRAASSASSRSSSVDEGKGDAGEEDTQVVEPEQGNILMHIISQLRPGADLSRVTLPTFILEPRSMLERITNFMCHPEMLLPIPELENPIDRFVSVVKFYLSGWHIRPPGVKKPLNPILGEVFTCWWDLPDGTRAYYISEQTSHHPPKSSYFYMVPEHHIRVDGTLKPRSKFLGNSAASLMEGTATLTFLNRGKDPSRGERYYLTQPNMYARGILFGKMKYELGDHSFVRCPELGLVADIEFKTKGWVGGMYNAIGGFIKDSRTGEQLFELSGLWSEEMYIKDLRTGHKDMFFNALKAKPSPPKARPIQEQHDRESQKLWKKTAEAVMDRNHELATDEKTKIEDMQREEAAKRAEGGGDWHPRLFRRVKAGPGESEEGDEGLEWIIHAKIDGATPEQQAKQILAIFPILPDDDIGGSKVVSRKAASSTASSVPTLGSTPQSAADIGDLIDFGQNDSSVPAVTISDADLMAEKKAGDIESLLKSTGKPAAEGPLIDFHQDMQKDLKGVPRSDTLESQEFHDAES